MRHLARVQALEPAERLGGARQVGIRRPHHDDPPRGLDQAGKPRRQPPADEVTAAGDDDVSHPAAAGRRRGAPPVHYPEITEHL
jgi:hypothetical protein